MKKTEGREKGEKKGWTNTQINESRKDRKTAADEKSTKAVTDGSAQR